MRTTAQVLVLALASVLSLSARAQSPSAPGSPDAFPYPPPPGFALGELGLGPSEPVAGSRFETPEAAPPQSDEQPTDELDPDETIAEGYDDGYAPAAYADFQDALAPYGSWENDADYGELWIPSGAIVGADFLPYFTNGHWVLSEYGWTWISDWSWGWAPFHYGRWLRTTQHGWCWVPGTNWGPAWVAWRSGGGYVGWAPLPPGGVALAAAIPAQGPLSPWRFTPAASLAASHATGTSPSRLPGIFRRTSVVASDRLLTHGPYAVRVNAGPVRVAPASPVRLATAAPLALPRAAVFPQHPGAAIAARPFSVARASVVGGLEPTRQQAPFFSTPPPVAAGVVRSAAPPAVTVAPRTTSRAPGFWPSAVHPTPPAVVPPMQSRMVAPPVHFGGGAPGPAPAAHGFSWPGSGFSGHGPYPGGAAAGPRRRR